MFGSSCLIASVLLGAAGAGTAASPPAAQPAGLAAKYPGDRGIAADPAVVLHEDFEQDSTIADRKKWPEISNKAGALKVIRDPNDVFGGKGALQITATLGQNTGGHLFRRLPRGYDRLYARYAVRFAPDCDYTHHFVRMGGDWPATPWPTGGAGELPSGDDRFSLGVEPWGFWGKCPPPGGWHFYNYWWKMKRGPDGKYWGQGPAKEPYAVPRRGQWYVIEFMAACNTPGKDDGELAVWIDGRPMGRYGDVNWRADARLRLNYFLLMLYVTDSWAKTNKVNTVWFDDVVVATEYIGPPVRPAAR